MRILVTRPEPDAATVAAALSARDAEVVLEPLLRIEERAAELPDLDAIQAILFTSANGVRAFASQSARRDRPVLAVGDATAQAARDAGFTAVASAAGDVTDLVRLVVGGRRPADGPLLHVAGTVSAGDLAGDLTRAGFAVERVVLYEAVPVTAFSQALRAELEAGTIDAALFFSPRSASLFLGLAKEAGLRPALERITAYALSPAVAAVLAGEGWRRIVTAAEPTLGSLLAAVDQEPPFGTAAGEGVAGAAPSAGPLPNEPTAEAPFETVRAGAEERAAKSGATDPAAVVRPASDSSSNRRSPLSSTSRAAPNVPPVRRRSGAAWLGLVLLTLLVLAGVGTAPWWTKSVLPLLPWARHPQAAAAPAQAEAARAEAARVEALRADADRAATAIGVLQARISALETTASPLPDRLRTLEGRVASLLPEIDGLKAATRAPLPSPPPARTPSPDANAPAAAEAVASQAAAMATQAAAIATLSRRLDVMTAELGKLEQASGQVPGQVTAVSGRLDRLDSRLTPLDQRVTTLEQVGRADQPKLDALQPAVQALSRRTEAINGRLEALQKNSAEAARARLIDAVVPAAAAVRAAAAAGQPFAGPLSIIKGEVSAGNLRGGTAALAPALAVLETAADGGVASARQLAQEFPAVAGAMRARAAAGLATGQGNWWEKARAALGDVVRVSRTDPAASSLDGTLAGAEKALASDDLGSAAAALERASGPAAEPAKQWLARAQKRLEVLTAADALVASVDGAAALARDGNPPSAPAPSASAPGGAPP